MTLTLERLEEALAPDTPRDDAWKVDGLETASWAARKAASAASEIRAIDAWEAAEIDRVRAAAATERKRHQNDLEFFEGALGQYLAQLVREGRKTKTLDLPAGRVTLRALPPQLTLDEDRALAWARQTGQFVRTKESFDKSAFRKRAELVEGGMVVTPDGEVADWATWSEQPQAARFTPTEEDS